MSDQTPSERYADEATKADAQLDARLAEIRRQSDDGTITVRKAADLRVAALERHLAEIRALRVKYFGGGSEH